MFGAIPAAYGQNEIPSKIQVAITVWHFAEEIRRGRGNPITFAGDSPTQDGRELSKIESEVCDSSLTTLLEFFNTPGFGDQSQSPEPPGEDPKQPQPVTA